MHSLMHWHFEVILSPHSIMVEGQKEKEKAIFIILFSIHAWGGTYEDRWGCWPSHRRIGRQSTFPYMQYALLMGIHSHLCPYSTAFLRPYSCHWLPRYCFLLWHSTLLMYDSLITNKESSWTSFTEFNEVEQRPSWIVEEMLRDRWSC